MTVPLIKNIDSPKTKYLVFTSAGDNSNLHSWLEGDRNFDLWVTYYGDEENPYTKDSNYCISKKAGKFPNLHYAYQHWSEIFKHYQAILVMDDDIVINASEISRLFEIREQYDLWLLQPAFNPKGKVSHPITQLNPFTSIRYTNFVEVTCPLFRTDKLNDFMEVYDPVLVGWGIDYWFLDLFASEIKGNVAVVDEISCINPHDRTKGGQREIDLLQITSERIKNWEKIKEQHNIQEQEHIEFDALKRPLSLSKIIDGMAILIKKHNKKITSRFKAKIKRTIHRLDKLSPYPVFYPFVMSNDEKVVFDEAIRNSNHYLEFGLGGSSLRAIQKSKANIYTVESSSDWINQMRQYMILRYFENKRLHIFPVNIGPTQDWGFPAAEMIQIYLRPIHLIFLSQLIVV